MPAPVKITETKIPGLLLVEGKIFRDERGYFTEAHSQIAWEDEGFSVVFVQDSVSESAKGTLRGMHFQVTPHAMGKLVRALRGSIFDVGVDLRRGSPTYGEWVGKTLSAQNGLAMYFPPGIAHGFLALEEETLVYYKSTASYAPEAERVLSYKDPGVGIEWPAEIAFVNERDAGAPNIENADFDFVYEQD